MLYEFVILFNLINIYLIIYGLLINIITLYKLYLHDSNSNIKFLLKVV